MNWAIRWEPQLGLLDRTITVRFRFVSRYSESLISLAKTPCFAGINPFSGEFNSFACSITRALDSRSSPVERLRLRCIELSSNTINKTFPSLVFEAGLA